MGSYSGVPFVIKQSNSDPGRCKPRQSYDGDHTYYGPTVHTHLPVEWVGLTLLDQYTHNYMMSRMSSLPTGLVISQQLFLRYYHT